MSDVLHIDTFNSIFESVFTSRNDAIHRNLQNSVDEYYLNESGTRAYSDLKIVIHGDKSDNYDD